MSRCCLCHSRDHDDSWHDPERVAEREQEARDAADTRVASLEENVASLGQRVAALEESNREIRVADRTVRVFKCIGTRAGQIGVVVISRAPDLDIDEEMFLSPSEAQALSTLLREITS